MHYEKVEVITKHNRLIHKWKEVVTLVLAHLGDKASDILAEYAHENMSGSAISNYIEEVTLYFVSHDETKKGSLQEYVSLLYGTEFADDFCLGELLCNVDDGLYVEILTILDQKGST